GNSVLVAAARPEASDVRSYDAWLDAGRQIRKGERGVRGLVPHTRPAASLIGPGGPSVVDGLESTVVFDIDQTGPRTDTGAPPVVGAPVRRAFTAGQVAAALGGDDVAVALRRQVA